MQRIFILFLLLISLNLNAQKEDFPYKVFEYKYIKYDKNVIQFPGNNKDFHNLWQKLTDLITKGQGRINVVHFGGSHLQAGIYSGRTRQRLQNFYPGLNGGRGLVFPFVAAKTRGPRNYYFKVTGKWKSCKNVGRRACYPGLLGIQATTRNPHAKITAGFDEKYGRYDFNKIKIFHDVSASSFVPTFPDMQGKYTVTQHPEEDYTEVKFDSYLTTLNMGFEKQNEYQNQFTLYGISFETDDPGIVYHDVGINGASLPSFIKCTRLVRQLKAINPDLVIVSLGTNDTYTRNFKPDYYKSNYQEFINMLKEASPNTAIIMTVPNDCYFRQRYPNPNTALAEEVILETAKENNCGVWDFYNIMGGLNSSSVWYRDRLMVRDRIHFSPQGYMIKGDLFFFALLRAYDKHIEEVKKKTPSNDTIY